MTRAQERSIIAAASVGMALCVIPIFLGTFPLFLYAISQQNRELGAAFPALLLFSACVSAVASVFTGWLVDRFGARRVAIPGVLFFGLSVCALSLTDRAGAALFPLYALLGLAAAFTGPVVFAKAISHLEHIGRGPAFGIAITAAPMLSAALLAPVAQLLIGAFGWQNAYLCLGAAVICIAVPTVWAFLSEAPRPPSPGRARHAEGKPEPRIHFLIDSRFLLPTGTVAISAMIVTGICSHLLPIAQDRGLAEAVAVWTVSVFSLGALAGSLLSSALIDRAGRPGLLLLACFAVTLCGIALLRFSHLPMAFVLGGTLFGAGHYGAQALLPAILSRYFGVARLGQIFGACTAVVSISASLGPVVMGMAHARNLSFPHALEAAIFVLIASITLLPWLRPFPPREADTLSRNPDKPAQSDGTLPSLTERHPMQNEFSRSTDNPVEPLFIQRWSPRSFDRSAISQADLFTLFDAARWAPSSFNRQPWRFIYSHRDSETWEMFLSLLEPFNAAWVQNASVLLFIASDKMIQLHNSPSPTPAQHHSFDAGAAWALFALQATRMGLATHGLAGVDFERARVALEIPENFHLDAGIALGRRADKALLPERLQGREGPSGRNPVESFAWEGRFGG